MKRAIPNEITKNKPPLLTFSKTWSFYVVVFQRTTKKCTKNYNARAQLLFCSLNLLFCGVLVAVTVVVCLRACLHGGGGPQVGEVTRLAVVEKWPAFTCKLTTPGSRGDFT